jgi:hypothetical protein
MRYRLSEMDQSKRVGQKQASRDQDRARLASGEITAAELAQENGFGVALDLASFEIIAIGGRPIGRAR